MHIKKEKVDHQDAWLCTRNNTNFMHCKDIISGKKRGNVAYRQCRVLDAEWNHIMTILKDCNLWGLKERVAWK